MGGVSAMVGPTTILKARVARPWALRAVSRTGYSPGLATVPVRIPVAESSDSPDGKPAAENCMGRAPVAGTR